MFDVYIARQWWDIEEEKWKWKIFEKKTSAINYDNFLSIGIYENIYIIELFTYKCDIYV